MPTIPQYYREQKLAATAGNAIIDGRDVAIITQPYREGVRAGNVLTQSGYEYLKIDEQARYHDELESNRTKAIEQFSEFDTSLNNNADTSTYDIGLSDLTHKIRSGAKFKNGRAEADFKEWLTGREVEWRHQTMLKKWQINTRNAEKNYDVNLKTLKELGANAPSKQEYTLRRMDLAGLYGIRIDAKTQKEELIEGWDNPLLDSPEVRVASYRAAVADMDRKRGMRLLENGVVSLGYQDGLKWISDPESASDAMAEFGLTLEDFTNVSTNIKNLLGAQRDAAKQNQQKTQNDFLVKIENRQLTTDAILNSDLEPTGEGSKNFFLGLVKNQADGGDIVTDQRVKGDLQEKAMDIWTGAVTREQFNLDLAKARYEDKTIDGAAYNELRTLATREVKNYQAEAVKEAFSYGRGQLVTVDENVLATLLAAVNEGKQDQKAYDFAADRRKLELDNYAEYQRGLQSWLRENPKAQADDIYTQSRKLRAVYFGKSLTQIKAEIARRENSVSAGVTPVTPRQPGESIADYLKRTGKK